MLVSPYSRRPLHLVQFLRGWLLVVVFVDFPCFCKPKKSCRWFCNYCCIFSCKWDNAVVMVLCDYHYTNNMELLIVWQFPFSLSVCPQSLFVPGFLWQFSLTGWCKWWLQNTWRFNYFPQGYFYLWISVPVSFPYQLDTKCFRCWTSYKLISHKFIYKIFILALWSLIMNSCFPQSDWLIFLLK